MLRSFLITFSLQPNLYPFSKEKQSFVSHFLNLKHRSNSLGNPSSETKHRIASKAFISSCAYQAVPLEQELSPCCVGRLWESCRLCTLQRPSVNLYGSYKQNLSHTPKQLMVSWEEQQVLAKASLHIHTTDFFS